LAEWNRQFDAGMNPNAASLKKEFNAIKYTVYPWLDDIHRDAHAEPFTNLAKAWSKFFKDLTEGTPAHVPVFKKKGKCRDSFYVANDKFKVKDKEITLPIVGKVQMTEQLRFEGKILGLTVCRSANKWFASIQVEIPQENVLRKRIGHNTEGVDLGITSAAALSTGEKIIAPKPLKSALRRLKIRSRRLSRKLESAKVSIGIRPGQKMPKGTKLPISNNSRKASAVLAKTHYRIACIRSDFTHKLTNRLCRENQALGLEDLNVRGMLKNHRLARAISDVGMGEFCRQMQYKAKLYGTRLVIADRWFPSSKMCSVCNFVHSDLTLSDRNWSCPKCGTIHDRDINAANNLKRLATETALPAASNAAMRSTDTLQTVFGGKVTPVSYDPVRKKNQGRKMNVHFRVHSE
jgi:putative transposase